jgi:hypothetical protein
LLIVSISIGHETEKNLSRPVNIACLFSAFLFQPSSGGQGMNSKSIPGLSAGVALALAGTLALADYHFDPMAIGVNGRQVSNWLPIIGEAIESN